MAVETGDWVRITHPAIKMEGEVVEDRGRMLIVEDRRFRPVKRIAARREIVVAAARPQTGLHKGGK